MKNKKSFLSIILVVVLFVAAISGSASAYMKTRTPFVENEIVPATVSCEVTEVFENNEKTSIKVENTGNTDAYIRVCIVSYAVNIVDGVEKPVADYTEAPEVQFDEAKWKKGANNIYYYTEKVAPHETVELLEEGEKILLEVTDEGNKMVVEVFAEACLCRVHNRAYLMYRWGNKKRVDMGK